MWAPAGRAVLVLNNVARGDDGMISTTAEQFQGNGYALEFGTVDITWADGGWATDTDWLGQVQIRTEGASSDIPLFVGIGSASDVSAYLAGVQTDRVTNIGLFPFDVQYNQQPGQAPATPPAAQDFWVASGMGVGPQTVTWDSAPGRWVLVVMNADGSQGVSTGVEAGATMPFLDRLVPTLLALAGIGLGAVVLLVLALRPTPARCELLSARRLPTYPANCVSGRRSSYRCCTS